MTAKQMSKGSRLCAILLAVILSSFSESYANGYRSVVVNMTDGTTTVVALEADMTMRFTETSMEFISADKTTITLDKQSVGSMLFSEMSGIPDVVSDEPGFNFSGDALRISGLTDGSVVAVFDAAGRCVSRESVMAGEYELCPGNFPAGVYIVNVNGVSYKIEVK